MFLCLRLDEEKEKMELEKIVFATRFLHLFFSTSKRAFKEKRGKPLLLAFLPADFPLLPHQGDGR